MKTFLKLTVLFLFSTASVWGQSALDGTTFRASVYNLPTSVGVTRIVDATDAADSNCESADGTPVGNDVPADPAACLSFDSGVPDVEITFNGAPVPLGEGLFQATVVPFAGLADPIETFNDLRDQIVPISTYQMAGEIIEFTFRTPDDSFPASNEEDFWGFSAVGIQYPNATADSEVAQYFEEEVGNYVNSYFWFETADGTATEDYQIRLDTGIGRGRHPIDPDREVVYPFFSDGQQDSLSDTPLGGSLDYHSHGSVLSSTPELANFLVLGDVTWLDGLEVTGFGIGLLVQPPESGEQLDPADIDGDGQVNATDIDTLSGFLREGINFAIFDLNNDGEVNGSDRDFWIESLVGTFPGDTDLNQTVDFNDFLALSTNFGQRGDEIGWAQGDFDGDGSVQFPDFLALSTNFGRSNAGAETVPEPTGGVLFGCGLFAAAMLRRRRGNV